MDIIAAHQQGLIEQLDHEVAALAGRAGDHGQRAVVLHHLYDHSRGEHRWALAEAFREARIAGGIVALERRLARWGWRAAARSEAKIALDGLTAAIGEGARDRAATAYRAYRLSATKALRGKAEQALPPALLGALDRCHDARRGGAAMSARERDALADASFAVAADPCALEAAWAAIDATRIGAAARRRLGPAAMARADRAAMRRGMGRGAAARGQGVAARISHQPGATFLRAAPRAGRAAAHAVARRRRPRTRRGRARRLGGAEG